MRDLFDDLDDAPEPPPRPDRPHPALGDTAALLALLERWVARGWLRALDRALVVFLQREVPDASAPLLLAAALASHQLGRGHVCLDLATTLAAPDLALSLPPEGDDLSDPPPLPSQVLDGLTLGEWEQALAHPGLVADGDQGAPGHTPLVRGATAPGHQHQGPRLYLRRYWQYEQDIRQQITARLNSATCGNTAPCGSTAPPRDGADRRPDDATSTSDGRRPDNATDTATLAAALDALFPTTETIDWQQAACALAARSPFAVITGGPGTGKTTTVVKLLALLQALQLGQEDRHALRIRLAAPTGKAAARLNDSIAKQVKGLSLVELASAVGQQGVDISTLRDSIPTEVTTLHRLLGSRPDTRHFRHHAGNPLALDVLVIDEASMVDIEMMAAVLTALPPRARLVLLGDKDQLASVEAGAVLGDLCQRAEGGHYTRQTAEWLEAVTGAPLPADYRDDYHGTPGQPLDQAIAMLRVSHRFDAASGIGQLAEAVNRPLDAGHTAKEKRRAVRQVLEHTPAYADLARLRLADADDPALDRLVVDGAPVGFPNSGQGRRDPRGEPLAPPTGYRHYLEVLRDQRPTDTSFGEAGGEERAPFDAWARAVLEAHGRFQLLCALRRGPWGIDGLNPRIGQALRRARLIAASDHELESGWFEGRPVLVTRNDYGLGLMNGDIGITLALPDDREPGRRLLRIAFPASDGSGQIKWVLPSRLQAVETVFAMTVHKSQGSEFTHTALLLPDAPNPILTRELVYTGITRARDWLTLVETGRGMLDEAVTREVMRVSGLGKL
ncbi:exodeoxyribonuclease V subunit alpha [Halomonas heilongjiangensis]|uniref:RecBCD enzyme subunit RecD n=1 Tax=Halomonas heilongjiangensis TaxID=1387883 RepID=A0A2N7TL60_9GAMM|nr:exodeoxyribonuclease V subunit alpha [Halomonas heilongjiangensis]PMR68921.1 exodeoxyribonuclease V subunit alpha [Halomonas heilongjiangensis]PXX87242.1 exodeoxyribonuclease V subunit alpha [Halomonas heilongjiangensis]